MLVNRGLWILDKVRISISEFPASAKRRQEAFSTAYTRTEQT
jgi:hypothetical protein